MMVEQKTNYKIERVERNVLNRYRSLWDRHAHQLPDHYLNMHPDWLESWVSYRNTRIEALVITDDQGDLGMLFYTVIPRKLKGMIRIKSLRLAGIPDADWMDIFLPRPDDAAYSALWQALSELKCQEIILQNLHEDSAFLNFLRRKIPDVSRYLRPQTKCFYIDTNEHWEQYLSKEASKQFVRQDIRRLARRLGESTFSVEVRQSDLKHPEEDIRIIKHLHASSQRKQNRESPYSDKAGASFLRELITKLQDKPALRIYYLLLDGEVAAFISAYYYREVFYYWNIGYDTQYEKYSPSKFLLFHVLKACFEDHTREFNFMRGESYYKTKWTKKFRTNFQVKIYSGRGLAGLINRIRRVSLYGKNHVYKYHH